MSISWDPYVWDAPHPVEPGEIESIERQWGVSLPDDYRSVVSMHQGMTPNPHIIDIGRGDSSICAFLAISEDESSHTYSIRDAYELLKPHIPLGVYPFALTGGGEYVCFDYRGAPSQPRIVFVTVETDIHPIADSFSEFMEKLHD
ncbi:SMI1/KNR4 family protein [Archangium gephyra]|uniref:SMI1/KNR4 family protein n=1 Tax=Archangium gephyra TaxID=48 RepID=UPI0035D44215